MLIVAYRLRRRSSVDCAAAASFPVDAIAIAIDALFVSHCTSSAIALHIFNISDYNSSCNGYGTCASRSLGSHRSGRYQIGYL